MRVYAKCLDGEEEAARHRIGSELGIATDPPAAPSATEEDPEDDGQAPVPVPA
jgi:hypothetical protein